MLTPPVHHASSRILGHHDTVLDEDYPHPKCTVKTQGISLELSEHEQTDFVVL